jgi:hypothetical protein
MKPRVDSGAAAVAVALAGVALATLWQAREFSAFAAIFPRAVGTALLISSLLVLWRVLRSKAPAAAPIDKDAALRSGLLVLTLVAWVAMLETAGFGLSGWISFVLLALLAHRGRLRAARLLGLVAAALLSVLLLQLLFQRGLGVRLPAGTWLPGLFG